LSGSPFGLIYFVVFYFRVIVMAIIIKLLASPKISDFLKSCKPTKLETPELLDIKAMEPRHVIQVQWNCELVVIIFIIIIIIGFGFGFGIGFGLSFGFGLGFGMVIFYYYYYYYYYYYFIIIEFSVID
jgi:hypothetical protein